PTATNAVKEKRRPPLTTLATRLISITRSWRSSPRGLTVSTLVMSMPFIGPDRVAGWRRRGSGPSELQPFLAGAFCKRLDATVELVATAVEDTGLDIRFLGALGEQLAGPLRLRAGGQFAQLRLGPVDRRQGVPRSVVDELSENSAVGAVDGKPG